jgi:hypothetical protein
MIHTKDHKTLNIFDPFAFLGPKRKQLVSFKSGGMNAFTAEQQPYSFQWILEGFPLDVERD